MIFQFGIPTKTLFGVGQLNHLHEQMMPGKKALLILSNGISAKKYGYLNRTEKELHWAVLRPFFLIKSNPILLKQQL